MKFIIPLPKAIVVELSCNNGCFVIKICARQPAVRIVSKITKGGDQENKKMQLQVGVDKGSIINVAKDADGNPREVDGPIVCHVTPDGVVSLVPTPDGKTCDIIPVAPGTATYSTTADADLSATGTDPISGNDIAITVLPVLVPRATHIDSTEGPVVPQ